MNLENKVFLVTGAGSGLGAAVAAMAVAAGARVLLLDVNAEGGRAVAEKLGPASAFVKTDVTSGAEGEAAVQAALAAFGKVDVLVNCAGIAPG